MKSFLAAMTAALVALALAGCATSGGVPGSRAGTVDAGSYTELGLSPTSIEPWEDGMRTDGGPGTYEWWYFDFTMEDGSTLVIAWYTKLFTQPGGGLNPFVTVQYDRPGQALVSRTVVVPVDQFSASKTGCDVTMGTSTLRGDLTDYVLHVDGSGVKADLSLHRTTPSWRPGTGYLVFRKPETRYFAWLPSVPQSTFEGSITVDGTTTALRGAAYHDHNWGDASLLDLIHHWYWGRAQVGPWTVIASYIAALPVYGSIESPVFMLARDGKIVADDGSKLTFSASGVYTDTYTGKPVANQLVYDWKDGASHYRVTFNREKDINRTQLVSLLDPFKKALAQLAGFDGAYLRFTGPVTVEDLSNPAAPTSDVEQSAVWELMYLGRAPKK